MKRFDKLFEPGKIGTLELKNRIIFPPIVTHMVDEEGCITDQQIEYYAERARGGASLIVIEASYPRSSGYPGRIMLRSDSVIPGLKKLVNAIHKEGANAVCQVNTHRGRGDDWDPASPSNVPNPISGALPRQVSIMDLSDMKSEFGKGVERVVEAGFDGVMIHGATGYLVAEFLSPLVNRRNDEYGGSLENRARFALELVEETRRVVGSSYPVIFRLTADEKVPGGFEVNDAISFCKMLEDSGVDAVDVTSGSWGAHEWTNPTMYLAPACNADLSEAIRKEARVPVCVAGKINDPDIAEQILREGKADFVCIGRGLVADPYFPEKAKTGRADDINKCITCARCGELFWIKQYLQCSINPAAGNEKEFKSKLKPTTKKKRVLIIGGGPAGMEAALIAEQKGHDVTLWEKSDALGGQLKIAHVAPGKKDIKIFLSYLKLQIKKSNVKVELRKEGTKAAIKAFVPDSVVVATGSVPCVPNILGIKKGNVVDHREVLARKREVGDKIVVMGGGYMGCETALFLADRSKDVTLMCRSSEVALDAIYPDNRLPLLRKLKESGIKIEDGIQEYKEITSKGIAFIDKEGNEMYLIVDNIVCATGANPNDELAKSLLGESPELYQAGDCISARRIYEAIHEGAEAGRKI